MLYPLSYRPTKRKPPGNVTVRPVPLQRAKAGGATDEKADQLEDILRSPDMYAVISDIHGNLEALEAVLEDIPKEVEEIYCLGDVIGYGANPNECCESVRSCEMPVISGNHDLAVTDLSTDLAWFNPVAAAAIEWTREQLTPDNAEFLRTRPRMLQSEETLFVHGSVRDPDEYILNGAVARENLAVLTADYPDIGVCFFGHTHVKTIVPSPDGPSSGSHDTLDLTSGGPYLVNPGSVGQPRDGDTFASYVLAEDAQDGTRIAYRFVEYDVEKAQDKIRAAGLPGMLADRLALGR